LPYDNIFGGVSALTKEQFTTVNGFSNKFWGWGGEDDEMWNRLKNAGYHVSRYPLAIARYTALKHTKAKPNPRRYFTRLN
jgi:predicted glycosyltransferase involved in capsule biosynthesis